MNKSSEPYINTFNNQNTEPQWILDIGGVCSLWYHADIRQVVVVNNSDADSLEWMGSGEVIGSDGTPTLFSFPQPNGSLLTILPLALAYFSLDGNYSQAFSPTVTNAFVTLKDVEIKVVHEETVSLYHFNINNTCLETVNTIQVSPISETNYYYS